MGLYITIMRALFAAAAIRRKSPRLSANIVYKMDSSVPPACGEFGFFCPRGSVDADRARPSGAGPRRDRCGIRPVAAGRLAAALPGLVPARKRAGSRDTRLPPRCSVRPYPRGDSGYFPVPDAELAGTDVHSRRLLAGVQQQGI